MAAARAAHTPTRALATTRPSIKRTRTLPTVRSPLHPIAPSPGSVCSPMDFLPMLSPIPTLRCSTPSTPNSLHPTCSSTSSLPSTSFPAASSSPPPMLVRMVLSSTPSSMETKPHPTQIPTQQLPLDAPSQTLTLPFNGSVPPENPTTTPSSLVSLAAPAPAFRSSPHTRMPTDSTTHPLPTSAHKTAATSATSATPMRSTATRTLTFVIASPSAIYTHCL